MKAVSIFSAVCVALSAQALTHGATIGQMDDFQSPTGTLGWGGSHGSKTPSPQRIDGGSAGAGDYYLQLRANDYHVATRNQQQWQGDYLGSGIRAVEMDVIHLEGVDPIALRIAVDGPGGFFSSVAPLPIEQGAWRRYVFGLTAADLTYVNGGTGDLADTLSAVETLLVRHDNGQRPTPPGNHPQHVTATIGLDNIRAVPEPAAIPLLWLACALAAQRPRRRRPTA